MALNKIPSPVLDTRNGDAVVAAAIGSLPAELSDRSDSNPAVVIVESNGSIFDKDIFQLNQWPQAVIVKTLALVGINQLPAVAAAVTQTFTLSQPQPNDTVIVRGTLVSTSDGSLTFATQADLTVKAYTGPVGTITLTSGSSNVVGSGTTFTIDALAGYQISTDKNTWYTVQSVTNDTNLVLSANAASTVSGSSYFSGPITGTVSAQATTQGIATNASAGALVTLQSSPAGVTSTVNAGAATGGSDIESTTASIARTPQAYAVRDTACSASDYAYFAQQILGPGGRAAALANTNNTTPTNGYVTVAMLSPGWTTSTAVSAQERASCVRDLSGRTFTGATTTDVAANIQQFTANGSTPACCFYRRSQFDTVTSQVSVAAAINSYLSPNTYPWGRTVYVDDLGNAATGLLGASPLQQVDRIFAVNGVLAVGMNWGPTANSVVFTNGSATATANAADIGAGKITANQTYVIDPNVNATQPYLVTGISGTTLTLDHAFSGASITAVTNYFNATDKALASWYSLPFSNLSVSTTAPAPSMVVVGSV